LPQLFRDKRHKRGNKAKADIEAGTDDIFGARFGLGVGGIEQCRFDPLDICVAKVVQPKAVDCSCDAREVVPEDEANAISDSTIIRLGLGRARGGGWCAREAEGTKTEYEDGRAGFGGEAYSSNPAFASITARASREIIQASGVDPGMIGSDGLKPSDSLLNPNLVACHILLQNIRYR
jgi:hypothetical protein